MPNVIEIFKPGRHTAMNGEVIEFTEADLRATAAAYDSKLHEAPLVIGHPKLDAPAHGWVKSLAYSGTLDAEPHQVDAAFAELVQAGRFKKVSASFFTPDSPHNPKPGVYYVRHVGFLGAQPPAVKGLKNASFADHGEGVIEFADFGDLQNAGMWRRMREWIISKFGMDEADKVLPDYELRVIEDAARAPEASPAAFAEDSETDLATARKWLGGDAGKVSMSESKQLTEEERQMNEALATQKAELEKQQAEFAEREKKLRDEEKKAARKAVVEFAEGLVKSGKILPRDQNGLIEYLSAQSADEVIEFGEGDARVKKPAAGWLREFLVALPVQVDYGERAPGGKAAPASDDPSVIAAKALEFMEAKAKAGCTINIAQAIEQLKALA